VVLVGPNGVGKSMLACNLGHQALIEGKTVLFTTYADKPDFDILKGHCLLCVGKPQSALVLDV
jgi:MinD superfamily P-loop ATPase